jgi:hypothetical protein
METTVPRVPCTFGAAETRGIVACIDPSPQGANRIFADRTVIVPSRRVDVAPSGLVDWGVPGSQGVALGCIISALSGL